MVAKINLLTVVGLISTPLFFFDRRDNLFYFLCLIAPTVCIDPHQFLHQLKVDERSNHHLWRFQFGDFKVDTLWHDM